MTYNRDEEGQSIVLVVLAMGIFLFGAVGLGFDGSHLYTQRQRAQLAADAAAQAGMLSIFRGTSTSTAGYTCTTSDTKTPCVYARHDGFGGASTDTVTVSFPATSTAPGVSFASGFPSSIIHVEVLRHVNTFLMGMLGITSTDVKAYATAAIVSVKSPIPIVVLHPTMSSAFDMRGTVNVVICGGPSKSIQVNSTSSTASTTSGNSGSVDLSHAGPPGTCASGNGADFGITGGPTAAPSFPFVPGANGHYVPNASVFPDPLIGVTPPSAPAVAGSRTPLATGSTFPGSSDTCPAWAAPHDCTVLKPGLYTSGIPLANTTAIFEPGLYYLQGSTGLQCGANCNILTGTIPDGLSGTNTGWDGTQAGGGVMFYNTGTGTFNIGANGSVSLIGSKSGTPYDGILLFEDPTAAGNNGPSGSHSLGGGGNMTLYGTIYLTNRGAVSTTKYQELHVSGSSGNTTVLQGEIITDALSLRGGGTITMTLDTTAAYTINEVALVE
jgi:hypothetical protein